MKVESIRDQIDGIDKQLLDLFLQRMSATASLAAAKEEQHLPVWDRKREIAILNTAEEEAPGMEFFAHRFFANALELSKAYQTQLIHELTPLEKKIQNSCLPAEVTFPKKGMVAICGGYGSHADAAATRLIPHGDRLFLSSYESVFQAVVQGHCDFGIIPVETSSNGSVKTVYDLLRKYDVNVVRSINLKVNHELLANPGTKMEDITDLYSQEQAYAQCENFVQFWDGITVHQVSNTTDAAEIVAGSKEKNKACIASHSAGKLHNLICLNDDIMDTEVNYTRFFCIQKEPAVYAGADRISLILKQEHRPGSLYDSLSVLAAHGINIIKLESVPVPGNDEALLFYVDIIASVREKGIKEAINYLKTTCITFKYLGNYTELQ